jgi:hypothetical protein
VWDAGCRIQDAGFMILDIGDAGCRIQDADATENIGLQSRA